MLPALSLQTHTDTVDMLQASPLARAELHLTVAQSIQSLFCLYLQAHGTPAEEHPFAKEEVQTAAR